MTNNTPMPTPNSPIDDPELQKLLSMNDFEGFAARLDERKNKKESQVWLDRILTCNPKMQELKKTISKLAVENDSVLIIGETGTGKELVARALHGDRPGQFIALNCAGLPEQLLESELFGHRKGAFTGAYTDKTGLLEVANKGTIFLDEIGDMPMSLQAKLLRAIQENTIRRVGDDKHIKITCRFIAATHRDLSLYMRVDPPRFREDLFYRISTFYLSTTPLRDRREDIVPIARAYMKADRRELNHEAFFSRVKVLPLSGNVRELQQHVRRYEVLEQLPA